ncbi:lipase 1-like [Lycorma delicatula]|uniref:lipase 1-like n=1 Tax=Lycorma delicatula TaxID=130591 RepID=UPI003F510F97
MTLENMFFPWKVFLFLSLLLINCGGKMPPLQVLEAMTAEELIRYYGYSVETHKIITLDGYIITLHRLPRRTRAPPVLIQHGIMGSTETWVMQGPKKDLPYIIYNAGFDVWIGNARGSIYGRKHINMTLEDPNFWEFSWHEMGLFDLPAMLDYIIALTGYPDVNYIGHSMGTTMFYVMGSERPDYNSKIRISINMAPVAYMNVIQFIYRQYAKFRTPVKNMLIKNKIYELLPMNKVLRLLQADLCRDGSIFQLICIDMLFVFTGSDWKQFNKTMIPMYLRHASPSSIQTLDHYSQLIGNPGTFQAYDYKDPYKNYEKYGRQTPPIYNISKVTTPVALIYAKNDYVSRPIDVDRIARELPNVVMKFLIPYNNFNHIDYLWGEDSKKMVYDHLINLLYKFSPYVTNNNYDNYLR